jgi:hypothetical protein
MGDAEVFSPAKRNGLIFHIVVFAVLGGSAAYGLWLAANAEIGLSFILALLPALLALAAFPVLAYRLYALYGAHYTIRRDGMSLRWGLRQEDIPIDQIVSVRSSSEYLRSQTNAGILPRPMLGWPGAVLGVRALPDKRKIEFMADRSQDLILVSTQRTVYAISPSQPEEFLRAYARFSELGAIVSLPAQSLHPSFLLARFWADGPARTFVLVGTTAIFLLWLWVMLVVPGRSQIPWYLDASGQPAEFVPAVRLMLLPTLALGVYVLDLMLGFFFFRRQEYKVLAYLFWFAGIVTVSLFGVGVFFIAAY